MAQPASFIVYFRSLQTNIITPNIFEKCLSSIRCRDSNQRPLEHESPPLTTRPGLPPPLSVFISKLSYQSNQFSVTPSTTNQFNQSFGRSTTVPLKSSLIVCTTSQQISENFGQQRTGGVAVSGNQCDQIWQKNQLWHNYLQKNILTKVLNCLGKFVQLLGKF